MTKIAQAAQKIQIDPGQDQTDGWRFEKIKDEEVEEMLHRRKAVETELGLTHTGAKDRDQLVGLAFSGGGIRSATFNLGVLQGLAKLGLLPWFDYLSTVSGGGYIGSWLAAWIKRSGLKKVIEGLSPTDNTGGSAASGQSGRAFSHPLVAPVQQLSYSTTWVLQRRHLGDGRDLPSQPAVEPDHPRRHTRHPAPAAAHRCIDCKITRSPRKRLSLSFLFPGRHSLALGIATVLISLNMETIASPSENRSRKWAGQTAVVIGVVVPLVLAASLSTFWIWSLAGGDSKQAWVSDLFNCEHPPLQLVLILAIGYTVPWLVGWLLGCLPRKKRANDKDNGITIQDSRKGHRWVLPSQRFSPACLEAFFSGWLPGFWNGGTKHPEDWKTP